MVITGCYNLQSLPFSTTPSWTTITRDQREVTQTKILVNSPFRPLMRVAFWFSLFQEGFLSLHAVFNLTSTITFPEHSQTWHWCIIPSLKSVKKTPILLQQRQFSAFWSRRQNYVVKTSPQVALRQQGKRIGSVACDDFTFSLLWSKYLERRSTVKQEKLLVCPVVLLLWKEQEE